MSSSYADYTYHSSTKDHTHTYLVPALIMILDKTRNRCILDIGCGNGWLANLLLEQGFNVYGTDASVTGIHFANTQNRDRFFVQDLTKDELPEALQGIKFDTIISTEVIEHLYSPEQYIKFCRQILASNQGGELIISTPYHGYLKNLALAISGKMDGHFTALWEGGHIKFWSKKTLTQLLESFGFEIVSFKGAGRFPYLWKSMVIKAKLKT